MSRTLTLTQCAWASVRTLARGGRRATALARLELLLGRDDLPAPLAADARRLAAELCLDGGHFADARRHLASALDLEPDYAKSHHLMGRAHEEDPHGDDLKAAKRFLRAAKLDPANATYRAAFGRAAVRAGRRAAGVRGLRKAAALAPGNEAVLKLVVDGLLEAGRVSNARRVLTAARFLCPGSRKLARLLDRVRFEAVRASQNTGRTQDAVLAKDGDFLTLPFVRVIRADEPPAPAAAGGTVRFDLGSRPRPHLSRPAGRADR